MISFQVVVWRREFLAGVFIRVLFHLVTSIDLIWWWVITCEVNWLLVFVWRFFQLTLAFYAGDCGRYSLIIGGGLRKRRMSNVKPSRRL